MALDKHALFEKLCTQAEWNATEDSTGALTAATVNQVIVHEHSKRWEIVLGVQRVIPFKVFLRFHQQVNAAFQGIADVTLRIEPGDPAVTEQEVQDYWPFVVAHSATNEQVVNQVCGHAPKLTGKTLSLQVAGDNQAALLSAATLQGLAAGYQQVGFPKYTIKPVVVAGEQPNHTKYQEKRAQSDAELTKKAMAAIQQQSQQRVAKKKKKAVPKAEGPVLLGRKIKDDIPVTQMVAITEEERSVVVQGYVFNAEVRDLRSGRKIITLEVTDYSSSFVIKKFSNSEEDEAQFANLTAGKWIKARGSVQEDSYLRDLVIMARDINEVHHEERQDTAEGDKRAELHLHTTMSTMDATNSISDYVAQAAKWGHKAIAVTDHGDLQAFPEAHSAGQKHGVKVLYGLEANVVDGGQNIAYNDAHVNLKDATYVVFDTETTGLSAQYDKVIELAAVKMKGGTVIDRFEEFIDPGHPLSQTTINLTSITDDMVRGSKSEGEVFRMFKDFCAGCVIVGHNATFDVDFMNTGYARHDLGPIAEPWIDTLPLARFLYPEMNGFRLNTLARKLNVTLEHHHRAIYDAEATGYIYYAMLKDAEEQYQITFHDQLNDHVGENEAYKHEHPFHAIIIAQTQAGMKNLFKLASASMTEYFYRVPRVPRALLEKYREGLLVGSACADGEVFTAMMQKGYAVAREKAKFYDYLEVQPKPVYAPLIEQELVKDDARLEEIIANMVKLGHELDKPVVATGDVHFMNKEDAIYRRILIHSQGGANPLNRLKDWPDLHFRTTDEMLDDFAFLGDETAHEIVVAAPQQVVAMVDDDVSPVTDKTYPPKMPGAEDDIKRMTMDRAHELYGDELPAIVADRLDRELDSIIGNGFAVHYLIAQKLVAKSNKDGYLVGSRGSVGSSLVATMAGITEVNPLPPHYRCPKCQWTEFYTKGEYGSGYDLEDRDCPECGTPLVKDGQDIPFETFLGFKGDKVPDIDLNFSGDYQPIAHNYMKVLFGADNVYRAGTIGTVADKTAYGFVKAYERDTEQNLRGAEVDRLAKGATGVKRTTGQHPAGILIVPADKEIYDFTPIQYPADDQNASWETTHFDFHSIHDTLLKMDILGHDDPTMIRMLQDLSGVDPQSIPTDDPGVMQLFQGTEVLGVTPEQIHSKTGTLGIPEFGTRFVRGMLEETKPKTFAELLKISGLSHGTDVWLGNAEDLIKNGVITMPEVIGCRDDIMMDLIHWGVPNDVAFNTMEHVRKGRGIPEEWQKIIRDAGVKEWYLEACLKIKYMFPKAHAAAYVLMALRIAYFKVYFPLVYYCAYFSVRARDFDIVAMARGKDAVKERMQAIEEQGNDAPAKDKTLLVVLELANEMLERGFKFQMVDLERSAVSEWLIDGDTLIAPFSAIPGLGENAAKQIVAAREEKPFLSKEDLMKRGHVSQAIIDFMTENHVLDQLPDENQLSLFDNMF